MTTVGYPIGPAASGNGQQYTLNGPAAVGLAITGAAAQTGDYVSIENSAGVDQFEVDSSGNGTFAGLLRAAGQKTNPLASGALPTAIPSTGVAFQCLTTRDVTLVIATTATLLSGTATIALSPDNVTFSTLGIATPGVASSVDLDTITVPAGWWVKITLSNATVTATYY
jgi:hypothetical protein